MTITALPYQNKLSGTYSKKVSFKNSICKANNQYVRKMGKGIDNQTVSFDLKYIGLTAVELASVETTFGVQTLGDVLSFKAPFEASLGYYFKPASWKKSRYYKVQVAGERIPLFDVEFTLVEGNELLAIPTDPTILFHFNSFPPINSGTFPTEIVTSYVGNINTTTPLLGAGSLMSSPSNGSHTPFILGWTYPNQTTITSFTLRFKFKMRTAIRFCGLLRFTPDSYINIYADMTGAIGVLEFNPTVAVALTPNVLHEISVEWFGASLYVYFNGTLVQTLPYLNPFTLVPITSLVLDNFNMGKSGNDLPVGEETLFDELYFVLDRALTSGGSSYTVLPTER